MRKDKSNPWINSNPQVWGALWNQVLLIRYARDYTLIQGGITLAPLVVEGKHLEIMKIKMNKWEVDGKQYWVPHEKAVMRINSLMAGDVYIYMCVC